MGLLDLVPLGRGCRRPSRGSDGDLSVSREAVHYRLDFVIWRFVGLHIEL